MNEVVVGSGTPDLAATLAALGAAMTQISEQLRVDKQEQRVAIAGVRQEVSDLRTDVHDEISDIKDSQYLEPWQAADVVEAAKTRVGDLFRDWCKDNNADMDEICHKYFGKFVRLIHNDAKKAGLEIGKIIYTPKKNYEKLLEFIGKWYPKRGIEGQMRHYDRFSEDK